LFLCLTRRGLSALLKESTDPPKGLGVDLGDPRLAHVKNLGNFFHRELFIIIKRQDEALLFRQRIERSGQGIEGFPLKKA
jgi:hypothetical protein